MRPESRARGGGVGRECRGVTRSVQPTFFRSRDEWLWEESVPTFPPKAAVTQGGMDDFPKARSLNWLDRETQKRLYRQSQELLQRAQTRAVIWCSPGEDPRGEGKPISLDTSFKTMAEYMDYVSSQCGKFHSTTPDKAALNHVRRYHQDQLYPMFSSRVRGKKYTSYDPRESYQGKKIGADSSKFDQEPLKFSLGPPRFDSGPSKFGPGPCKFDSGPSKFDTGPYKFGPRPSKFMARTNSKDITVEVSPGTYAVTVGSPNVTTTHMIEVDSGQIIDLCFPI